MVEIFNWFLSFVAQVFGFIFNDLVSVDGYSMGYMALGITIMGVIVGGTIGAVGIFSSSMEKYATMSHNDEVATGRARARNQAIADGRDAAWVRGFERGLKS